MVGKRIDGNTCNSPLSREAAAGIMAFTVPEPFISPRMRLVQRHLTITDHPLNSQRQMETGTNPSATFMSSRIVFFPIRQYSRYVPPVRKRLPRALPAHFKIGC